MDSTVKLWDTAADKHWTFRGHPALVISVRSAWVGGHLYSGSRHHTTIAWT